MLAVRQRIPFIFFLATHCIMVEFSETFRPIKAEYDTAQHFTEPELLFVTSGAKLYRVRKAGKFFMLKTPKNEMGANLELLKREYELSIGFSHPNIIHVYTYEPLTPVGPGIVMEYVDGRNLADYLTEHPSLEARIRIFEQLLDAVSCLHKADVIHNDLKPQNILITRANDDAKLIDFGLSDSSAHYMYKQLGCTPRYAAPELLEQAMPTDARSDIFSLGHLMHDLFGNRYARIVRKCLQENPDRRYPNVEALRRAWNRRKLPQKIAGAVVFLLLVLVPASFYVSERLHRIELQKMSGEQKAYYDSVTAKLRGQITRIRKNTIDTVRVITETERQKRQQMQDEIDRRKQEVQELCQAFDSQTERDFRLTLDSVNRIPITEFANQCYINFMKKAWEAAGVYTNQSSDTEIKSQVNTHTTQRIFDYQDQLLKQVHSKVSLSSKSIPEDAVKFYSELINNGQPYRPYKRANVATNGKDRK